MFAKIFTDSNAGCRMGETIIRNNFEIGPQGLAIHDGKNLHLTLSQTSNLNVKELRLLSKEMNNHTTLNNLNKTVKLKL